MEKQHPTTDGQLERKAKNKKQIAEEMGISPTTLRRYLKRAGRPLRRGLISPEEVLNIYRDLGWREKV